jgi:hypothetical protein
MRKLVLILILFIAGCETYRDRLVQDNYNQALIEWKEAHPFDADWYKTDPNEKEIAMTETEQKLQEECKADNELHDAYIESNYGSSYGPRRTYRWEVRGGEKVLVEQ